MPTSYYGFIPDVIEQLLLAKPISVLDIGVGFGKWGMLFREYCDVFCASNYGKEYWKTKIDGVEVYKSYIMEHQRSVYDEIFFGDALTIVPTLYPYDFIFAGDVLEHFSKDEGYDLLGCMREKSKILVMVVPLGENWKQGSTFGNDHEEHKAVWKEEDFKDATIKKVHLFNGKPIAFVVYKCQ